MALTKDDKEFLDLKFKPIENIINDINLHLAKINGKVQKHEETINSALIERAKNREHMNAYCVDIKKLNSKVDKLDENLLEYKIIKKYPKFSIVAMVLFGACLIMLSLSQFGVF